MDINRRARLDGILDALDGRLLRSFAAVAEERHFGRAAERLGITQPPLTIRIQRLEAILGVALFDRTNRRVELTEAGRVLEASLGGVFQTLEGAVDATLRAAEGATGRLAVAFASSVMFRTLPGWIRAFREAYPEVVLELRELPTGLQLPAIQAGELDVGFVREAPETPGVRLETVMREPLLLAVERGEVERAGEGCEETNPADLAAYAEAPFVLFPESIAPGLHAQVMALCRAAGFEPRVVQESRELYTTVSLVEAGVGVTIVPASIRKMGWAGVRYLPLEGVDTRIDLAWRPERVRPVVSAFLEVVRG